MEVPPGRRVVIVVRQRRWKTSLPIQIGVAKRQQHNAKHDGVRGPVCRPKGYQHRSRFHPARRLSEALFRFMDLFSQRFQRVERVWDAWVRLTGDFALMARQAIHRPIAFFVNDILQRPMARIVRPLDQSVSRIGHLAPLVGRRRLSLRLQRFLPGLPQLVEHLLIEIGRQIGLFQQESITALSRRLALVGSRFLGPSSQCAEHQSRQGEGDQAATNFGNHEVAPDRGWM